MLSRRDICISLVICVVLLCDNYTDGAMTMAQIENMAKGIRTTCQGKTGVDTATLDNMKTGQFPPDEKLQCYLKCVMTVLKSIKNGKPQLESILKQVKLMPVEKQGPLTAIAQYCVTFEYNDDPCVAAWEFVQCQYNRDPEMFFFP